MRIAVMSDIHGNIEAFEEVLRDIDASYIDRIINLGDSIGYGPDPEKVLTLIKNRDILNILGNHEQAALDKTLRHYFKSDARKSLEQTMRFLTPSSLTYLSELPEFRLFNRALFVHGCPPASCDTYLNYLSNREIKNIFKSYNNTIAFAGHTHKLMLISYNDEAVNFDELNNFPVKLEWNMRKAAFQGKIDYIPAYLSQIPRMFYSEQIGLDVALIQVSPPDKHGCCSLGVSVDITRAGMSNAAVVIAQINSKMVKTSGDSNVHIDEIDYLVLHEDTRYRPGGLFHHDV
jgi:predicted phosphodiesterase